jgi:hypothetical protein
MNLKQRSAREWADHKLALARDAAAHAAHLIEQDAGRFVLGEEEREVLAQSILKIINGERN